MSGESYRSIYAVLTFFLILTQLSDARPVDVERANSPTSSDTPDSTSKHTMAVTISTIAGIMVFLDRYKPYSSAYKFAYGASLTAESTSSQA
ncbi:hypothetical protein C0995_009927 [Termitomyces sp. Mi166|nr:hypothetical protein C0995_009927 [Termitomyces sp. Mi166\